MTDQTLLKSAALGAARLMQLSQFAQTIEPRQRPDPDTMRDLFLVKMRTDHPDLCDRSDHEIVSMGTAACQEIEQAGGDLEAVLRRHIAGGLHPKDACGLVGAAVYAFSPQYLPALEECYPSG